MKKRELTAYHEAGHAVVGWYLDLPPREIVINGDETAEEEELLGYVRHKYRLSRSIIEKLEIGHPDARTWDISRRLIISIIAGTATERHLAGRGRLWRAGAHFDLSMAYELAERLHGNEAQGTAFLRYCESVSCGMVAWKWKHIKAVAAALDAQGRLTFTDFREVLNAEFERQMTENDPKWRERVAQAAAGVKVAPLPQRLN